MGNILSIRARRATRKVFAITELLDMILLNVDPLQLFALQRVNTRFCDIIKTSRTIKQRMLLDEEYQATREEVFRIATDKRMQAAMHPFKIVHVESGMCLVIVLSQSSSGFIREGAEKERIIRPDTPCLRKEASWRQIKFPAAYPQARKGALRHDLWPFRSDRDAKNDWAFLRRNSHALANFGDAIDTVTQDLRVQLYRACSRVPCRAWG